MNKDIHPSPTLIDFIEVTADELDMAAQDSANYAFNLGCWTGLLPVLIIVILSFFLTNRSWVAAIIIAALMLMALLGLANLIAGIAQKNTVERYYRTTSLPKIEKILLENQVHRYEFDKIADEILPAGSMLRRYIQETTLEQPDEQKA